MGPAPQVVLFVENSAYLRTVKKKISVCVLDSEIINKCFIYLNVQLYNEGLCKTQNMFSLGETVFYMTDHRVILAPPLKAP